MAVALFEFVAPVEIERNFQLHAINYLVERVVLQRRPGPRESQFLEACQ